MAIVHETGCTIDYELNEMRVDTTRQGVCSQLLRMGFREITRRNSSPYRRFIGAADQIRFRRTKAERHIRAGKPPKGKQFQKAGENSGEK
jgi:hypothetical protein